MIDENMTWDALAEYLGKLIDDLPEEKQAEVEKFATLIERIVSLQEGDPTNKDIIKAFSPILSMYIMEKMQEYVLRNSDPGKLIGNLLFGDRK